MIPPQEPLTPTQTPIERGHARLVRPRLPSTVIALGVTSLFADIGSEMIFPLLPVFLVGTLGAGPTFLGLVEGAADTVSSVLKLLSGYMADRLPRRKPLVVFGYALAGVARPLVAAATVPWHVLAVRLADRIGKGTRSAPRDALIADVALPGQAGRAFGFHRAMDHAGAVIGPLAASALLAAGLELRTVFWFAAVPSAASIVAVLAARERRRRTEHELHAAASAPRGPLPRPLLAYLGILSLFALGNSSDAFLLLRARDLGVSAALVPVLWTVLHVTKLLSSYSGGVLADRLSRTHLIIGGWVVYAGVYVGLGLAQGALAAWILFAVYGLYYGLTEPAEKALVKDLAPPALRGRAFGYYNFILGASALPASLLVGWLWRAVSPQVALSAGAGLAAMAALLLAAWVAAYHRLP